MTTQTIGKYELLEELGHGGFGTVYRAREMTLDVIRAVKVLHPALVAAPEFIERFRREGRYAARLEHPHIVPVYELGEEQGRYFLAMKYLAGGSLKDLLTREGRLPFERALEIFSQIADALAYAYNQPEKLIHRDLKPGNILFETLPDGSSKAAVRLSDFGFAKALADASMSGSSASGGMLGTPAYMAPEIWRGKPPASPASDQYALACVFYEMLTGETLFTGDSPPEVMTKHVLDGPQFPVTWPADVPAGTSDVLKRALSARPEERYADVIAFKSACAGLLVSEDEKRLELERKAQAEEQAAREKAQREAQVKAEQERAALEAREKALRENEDRVAHERAKRDSEGKSERGSDSVSQSSKPTGWIWIVVGTVVILLWAVGGFNIFHGPAATAEPIIPTNISISEITETPVIEQAITATPTGQSQIDILEPIQGKNIDRLAVHTQWGRGTVTSMDLSQDGKMVVVGTTIGIYLYNANTLEQLWFHPINDNVRSVAISPDNNYVAASVGLSAKVWRISDANLVWSLEGHTNYISTVVFSPNSRYLATGSYDYTIRMWDLENGSTFHLLNSQVETEIRALAFSPDGEFLASGSSDGYARIWDVANENLIKTIAAHERSIRSLAFSPDGVFFATGSFDRTIKIWNAANGELIRTLTGHTRSIYSLCFLPDNRQLVSSSSDHTIRLWDVSNGNQLLNIHGHKSTIYNVRYSLNTNQFTSGSWDGTVKFWDASNGALIDSIQFTPASNFVRVTNDNSYIIVSSDDAAIRIFDLQGFEIGKFEFETVGGIDLSPNENLLAVGIEDGKIALLDVPSGALVGELHGPQDGVSNIAFSKDGSQIVAGYYNNTAIVWDVSTFKQTSVIENDTPVETVAYSPNGKMIATGSYNDSNQYVIKVWQLSDKKILQTFLGYETSSFNDITFSPDNKSILSTFPQTNNDVTTYFIEMRSIDNNDLLKIFKGHTSWATNIIFSNDGQLMASASSDNTIILWRVSDGSLLANIGPERETFYSWGINGIAFSPDMSFMVSVGQDSIIRIWKIQPK